MAIFHFGKQKDSVHKTCCAPNAAPASGHDDDAYVKVLGGGCARCNQLEAAAKEALTELHMDSTVGHITDYAQIAAYGVMSTPALMVGDKVVSTGRVLKKDEIVLLLKATEK